MNAETLAETSRVRDAESCREWLARLDNADMARLPSVDRLMRNLMHSSPPPEDPLEIAEQARAVHLAELDGVLDRIDAVQFPLIEADRLRLLPAVESLRLGRELYKQIHAGLPVSGDSTPATPVPLGSARARAGLPLARALDYQVRLLIALLRHRIEPPAEEWDELCDLAGQARAGGFVDVPLPDASPLLGKVSTPRALFAYPILLWLSAPGTRSEGAYTLAARLARRWCGRIGFRFDSDAGVNDVRHGPTVALTDRHTVRLVTHRLRRRLDDRRRELEGLGARAVSRLPKGMSVATAQKLLEDLSRLWCDPRLVPYVPDTHLGEIGLRFGLPRREDAPPGAVNRRPLSMHTQASRSYIYGHFEQHTVFKRSSREGGFVDPLRDWSAGAQLANWVSIERHQALFELEARAPGLCLGALALLVLPALESGDPQVAAPRASGTQKRLFGRVVSLNQRLQDGARSAVIQRVGVAMWSGSPTLVGVRIADVPAFEDGFLLSPDPATGDPHCVILPAGRFVEAGPATLREGARESKIRLEELLDRGAGFDRIRFTRNPA